jgi:hypothetical protein
MTVISLALPSQTGQAQTVENPKDGGHATTTMVVPYLFLEPWVKLQYYEWGYYFMYGCGW